MAKRPRWLSFASHDGGDSWKELQRIDAHASTGAGVVVDGDHAGGMWRFLVLDRTAVELAGSGGRTFEPEGLLGVVSSASYADDGLAWAMVNISECATKETCQVERGLMRLDDGGGRLGRSSTAQRPTEPMGPNTALSRLPDQPVGGDVSQQGTDGTMSGHQGCRSERPTDQLVHCLRRPIRPGADSGPLTGVWSCPENRTTGRR